MLHKLGMPFGPSAETQVPSSREISPGCSLSSHSEEPLLHFNTSLLLCSATNRPYLVTNFLRKQDDCSISPTAQRDEPA